ncbi:hypothetical protein D3C87_1884710 [compost metagenome]
MLIWIALTVAAVTVTVKVLICPPKLPVMTAVPGDTAVTSPLVLTVATSLSLLLQETRGVMFWLLPSE